MLSLELAKELKAAGLRWEMKAGDLFFWKDNYLLYDTSFYSYNRIIAEGSEREFCTWFPRLNQLLREIEGERYGYSLDYVPGKGKRISVWEDADCEDVMHFSADTPENTAGTALLWIYEQKKGGVEGEGA
jgi:hypothetical protein